MDRGFLAGGLAELMELSAVEYRHSLTQVRLDAFEAESRATRIAVSLECKFRD